MLQKNLNTFLLFSLIFFGPLISQAKASNSYQDFLESRLLSHEKNPSGGLEALEKALQKDPQSHYLKIKIAQALASRRDYGRATRLLKTVLAANPQKSSAWLLLGKIQSLQKKSSSARRSFIKCLDTDPLAEDCALHLARQEALAKDKKKGRKVLASYLKKRPNSVDARFLLAGLQSSEALAKKELEELLRYHPSHLPSHLSLGRYYEKKQNLNKALQHYIKVSKYQEDNLGILLKIGLLYYEAKKIPEATQYFQQAYDLDKTSEEVSYYLGLLYAMQNQFEEARVLFESIDLSSKTAQAMVPALANTYYQLGKKNKVGSLLKKSLKLYPGEEKFWEIYVSYTLNEKKYKTSLRIIQEGLEFFPKNISLGLSQAVALDKIGKTQAALDKAEKLLQEDPDNAAVINFLAYTYVEQGQQLERSLRLLQKAHALKPKSGYILDSLAWAYFRLGQVDKALDLTLKANQLKPKEAIIEEHLGEIYLQKGNLQKAKKYFKQAHESISQIKKPSHRDKIDKKRIRQRYLEIKKQ